MKIRRALLSVSDKQGLVELGRALANAGAEIVATGKTAQTLEQAGLKVVPIEKISGSPEAFQGRMKTLSFPVCSGILSRRGDASDEADLKKLNIQPIDCVVANFYPFEQTLVRLRAEGRSSRQDLVENIDIGGPTLVRSAAKNAPDTLVLTDPSQYAETVRCLQRDGAIPDEWSLKCAQEAWGRISHYDAVIAAEMGVSRKLKYGENPHQAGRLLTHPDSPIDWEHLAAGSELSYNNILDLTSAYRLAADLKTLYPEHSSVVIVKHNNPCGVAVVPLAGRTPAQAQQIAIEKAWQGDPVSAFGGVLVFTDPLADTVGAWLAERFVEAVAAPGLKAGDPVLAKILTKRKNLRAVSILRFELDRRPLSISVVGGTLVQDPDVTLDDAIRPVTEHAWPDSRKALARFGISVCRALKSNSLAIVRESPEVSGVLQLVGAGQGQPNRVEALKWLAVPRAKAVLGATGGQLADCVIVSDAFFPFRDTVEEAHGAGLRWIVQPGGSIKDQESIDACNELEVAMAFTGRRHFRH